MGVSAPARAAAISGRNALGGNSNTSQVASTSRASRSGCLAATIWAMAPPLSLPTQGDVAQVERVEEVGDQAAARQECLAVFERLLGGLMTAPEGGR